MSWGSGEILASDAEREAAVGDLQAHCVAGRLTVAELETRLEEVAVARTRSQLATSLRALPPIARSTPAPAATRRPQMPGVLAFTERMVVEAAPGRAREVALSTLAPALSRSGFDLAEQTEHTLVFEHRDSLVGAIVATVIVMPLGLLMLAARRRDQRIVFTFTSEPGGHTAVTIHGRASRRVRRTLSETSRAV